MQHLLLKAAATATTDQGVFEAVISTASIDRERDVVDPHGMVRALKAWERTGKQVVLRYEHSRAPDMQVGYVEPPSARVVGDEVVIKGWVDQSIPAGKDAWRLVKIGVMGFSFGYMATKATPRRGGGQHITEMDVFEVTMSPTPMNNDTRVLGWKAVMDDSGEGGAGSRDDDSTETPLQAVRDAVEELQEFISGERAEGDEADVALARRLLAGLQELLRAETAQGEDGKALRGLADSVALEYATGAAWLFPADELDAARAGDLKAVWSTSFVNDLPDSAFLYVAPGGSKDAEGKTVPRSNRMFPYKDADGMIDLPHLRNALARIPQSNLSPALKERLTAKAQRLLDAPKSIPADRTGQEAAPRSVDPLMEKADALALEFASDGESLRKPPRQEKAPPPMPQLTPEQLRERMRDLTLTALTGEDYEQV